MSDLQREESIRVLVFNGKKADWPAWEEKFLAKATRKGIKTILVDDTIVIPKSNEVLDESVESDLKKLATRQMNDLAYSELILSIDTTQSGGKVAFSIVKGSKSTDYKDGNANKAWRGLKAKYQPNTAPSRTKLHSQFYQSQLRKTVDPEVWITEMEDLRARLEDAGSTMADDHFMTQILNCLTDEYLLEVKLMEKRIGATNEPLTIEEMKNELGLAYERLRDHGRKPVNYDGEETALGAFGPFKGKCNNCGKIGHKAVACRSRESNANQGQSRYGSGGGRSGNRNESGGGRGFSGECHYCKKFGHRMADCRKKMADKADNAMSAIDRGNSGSRGNGGSNGGGNHRWPGGGKPGYNNDNGEVVLAMIEEDDFVHENDLLDFGRCDDICDDNRDEFAMMGFVCDSGYDYDYDADKKLMRDLYDESIESESNQSNDESNESESNESKSNESNKSNESTKEVEDSDDESFTKFFDDLEKLTRAQPKQEEDTNSSDNDELPLLEPMEGSTEATDPNMESDQDEEMPHLMAARRMRDKDSDSDSDTDDDETTDGMKEVPPIKRPFFWEEDWLEPTGTKLYSIELPRPEVANLQAEFVFVAHEDGGESTDPNDPEWIMDIDGETDTDEEEYCLMAKEPAEPTKKQRQSSSQKFTRSTWLADSAASCHLCNDDTYLFNVRVIHSPIKIGNGKTMIAKKMGDMKVFKVQQNGDSEPFILRNVKYVPELWVNLLSIPAGLKGGFDIGNVGLKIFMEKNGFRITFDKIIETSKGYVMGIELLPSVPNYAGVAHSVANKTIHMDELHCMLGHVSEETARKSAAFYGWKIGGKLRPCKSCGIAKAKQKSVSIQLQPKSDTPGERMFLDISSIKGESFGQSKFWLMALDDCTDYAKSFFLKKKGDTAETIVSYVLDLKERSKIVVKYIRCDDAGENRALEKTCIKAGLGIQFEYTAPGTPQRNGRVERKFATLYGRVRAMFDFADAEDKIRVGTWTECANTACDIENLIVSNNKPVSSYRSFYEKDPKYITSMRTFGEMAIVTNHENKKMRSKLADRGKPAMFLGYATNHSQDVYRMLNIKTNRVIKTRDTLWLNETIGRYMAGVNAIQRQEEEEEEDEYDPPLRGTREDIEIIPTGRDDKDTDIETGRVDNDPVLETGREEDDPTDAIGAEPPDAQQLNPKVLRAMKKLGGFFNPEAQRLVDETDRPNAQEEAFEQSGRDNAIEDDDFEEMGNVLIDRMDSDFAFLADGATLDEYDEPTKFKEAWNHEENYQQGKWREAITKEFKDMSTRKVWKKMKRRDIPEGRRCVKQKWIFKVKRNGTFRARLVACGYSQIPGVDFTEHFAPVVNDVTYRIMLVASILWQLTNVIVDVETAFLHGDLEEEIYMDCPEGLEHDPDECLLLQKTIYGLVQSARQFYKKFVNTLRNKLGFKGGYADPCLLTRRCDKGIVFIALYVDDCFCCGNKEAIQETVKLIQEAGFNVTIENEMTDYLSCEILFSRDRKKCWIGQPHLIRKLEKKFGEMVTTLQKYRTPGTPSCGIVRPTEESSKVSVEDQTLYRSGVGMLLYLVKHSRPDIANVVRELSKVMDGATMAAMKEMKRVIKFVMDTKHLGLKIEPKTPDNDKMWDLVIYCDSDWAGDKDTRISVAGFIVYLMGAPISWKSKAQRGVTLSSSEAEFVALSEAAKEIKFIVQVLISMGIPVRLPVICRVDNIGAIFMAENVSTSQRTKHIDTRYHFVREFVEEGFIKIIFVRTKENRSDGFTKNVTGEIYDAHVHTFMAEKTYLE